jgi:hypothetical protein
LSLVSFFDGTFIASAVDRPTMSDTAGEAGDADWKTGTGALALGLGGGIVGGGIGLLLGEPLLWLGIGIALGVVVTAGLLSTVTDDA